MSQPERTYSGTPGKQPKSKQPKQESVSWNGPRVENRSGKNLCTNLNEPTLAQSWVKRVHPRNSNSQEPKPEHGSWKRVCEPS